MGNAIRIQELDSRTRRWAVAVATEAWGSPRVVSRGHLHDVERLPGVVAFVEERPAGLATYRIDGDSCELVTLNSLRERQGVGTALVNWVAAAASASGCRRLWLVTTNDNWVALRFFQKQGFSVVRLHRHAVRESRRLKPEIPARGLDGIPIQHELELERYL